MAKRRSRAPLQEAERNIQRLQAEIGALSRVLQPHGAGLWPPLIDSVKVTPEYESALAAALGVAVEPRVEAEEEQVGGRREHFDAAHVDARPLDQTGPESGPSCVTRGFTFPSATVTTEISADPPLAFAELIRWSKAMRVPSGDHCGRHASNFPFVICTASPPAAGIT